jgi:hypothetical protein
MAGMDVFRVWILRSVEWLEGLSPAGRMMLVITLTALFVTAAYFGLLPSKHV